MAISSAIYSPNEWRLAIKNEADAGSANATSMQLVNIDPLSVKIAEGVVMQSDPRTGTGRLLKKADHFTTEEGTIKKISFSGIADTTVLPSLLKNILGQTSYSIAYNYSPTDIGIGDNDDDYDGLMTIALISPIAANTRIFPGCILDELHITGDPTTDGGRFHFSAVALSGGIPSVDQAIPSGMSAYSSTYYSFYDLDITKLTISGGAAADFLLGKFTLDLKANVRMFGFNSSGAFQKIARGLPYFDTHFTLTCKYDSNVMSVYQEMADGQELVVLVANKDSWEEASLGFTSNYAMLVADPELSNINEGAFVDFTFQPKAHISGNLIEMAF